MSFLYAFIFFPLDSALALYSTLFVVLILSGLGLPVPEEVTLLLGGYLAYLEFIRFWPALYTLVAGIIAADIFGYFLGRFAGGWLSRTVLRHRLPTKILAKAEVYFFKHGEKMVFFSRPLLGIRVAVPMLAGHFKMSFPKFLLFDILGAIPWTFFLVSVSYYFGAGLDLITEVREIKYFIFALFGLAIFVLAVVKFIPLEVRPPPGADGGLLTGFRRNGEKARPVSEAG